MLCKTAIPQKQKPFALGFPVRGTAGSQAFEPMHPNLGSMCSPVPPNAGSYRTLVLSTSQSLNTTFQTEVPEILPYCGPINSAEVQTQLYSKRFTPKIHSSPHNRQNQTLIAMHQLTLPLNPAEPQSSPH